MGRVVGRAGQVCKAGRDCMAGWRERLGAELRWVGQLPS